MKCYRVLVTDFRGKHWTPVIVADDHKGIAEKVETIYPDGIVADVLLVHVKHTTRGIVYPDASDGGDTWQGRPQ